MTTSLYPRTAVANRNAALIAVARVFNYLFGLLYTLLGVRLLLEMVEARRSAGFVQLIASLTDPFYAPFKGIVPSATLDGSHPIVWPIVVAILAYMLLHGAIRGLLGLMAR